MKSEPSLRAKLIRLIMEKGYLPYGQFADFVNSEGFKVSNAERRLRQSESPNIEPVMGRSKRGTPYIQGYRYKKPPEPSQEEKIKVMIQQGLL